MVVLPGAGHPAPATNGIGSAPPVPGPARKPGAATVREPGPAGLSEPCVVLKLGEIVLKGGNRHHFERILQENIRRAVRELGVGVRLWNRNGVMVLRLTGEYGPGGHGPGGHGAGRQGSVEHGAAAGPAAEAAMDRVAERVSSVMGIARVCRAARVAKDPAAAIDTAVAMAAGRTGSFAVRARRRDKRFPLTSADLNREIGARVQRAYGYPVDLSHPDLTIVVEVDQSEVFVYTNGGPGQGGLPVGMSGRALVLMSGGIDSPVAAYRMMRRGLRCDFLHFSGMPLTGPESVYKAYGLMYQLNQFQGDSRLYVVAFGQAQRRLASSGAGRLQIVAQRRLMLKTGEILARRLGAAALVTGDSLGQVSSQTLANLTALDDAVSLPILRPLIGHDKIEIIDEARRIATLPLSELPDQDCCTLLTPRQVETRARIEDLRRIEARLDAGDLAEELAMIAEEYRPDHS
ncbi:MAG TPA: tRNA uracil 4-sulfurtransferase ThiI [Streptosporangiaceae bacterium]|nr:tRNA uracil 4-sulfurtransferase ThiI [Streptosporangiaceae bacterium]